MNFLLNVDHLTSYRKKQIETFLNFTEKNNIKFVLLANSKNIKNLPSINEFVGKNYFIKSQPIKFFRYYIWQPKLISYILKNKPKLAVIWGEVTRINSWIILILKNLKLINTEIALWTHGIYGRENYIVKKFRLIYLSLSDHILVYSSYSKNLLVKNGIKKEKIFVIGNSIEKEKEYKLRKKKLYKKKILNLIFIGRVSKRKKIKFVKEIIENWNEDFFLTFTIIGPNIKYPKETEYKNSKLILKPAIYDPKLIQNYLDIADYGICPDNIGLFCITCLNSGLPIICHNTYPLHGPEGYNLIPNENSINIKFPINKINIKESILKAYKNKSNFSSNPRRVYDSLREEFKSSYVKKSINYFMETRFL